MITTIQINDRTLTLLKKLKQEMQAKSYEEAISKVIIERTNKESMAGSLRSYKRGRLLKDILKGLRDKDDRF